MKQVIRRGLKEIKVDEVAAPQVGKNHVLVRPFYSLISSGPQAASLRTNAFITKIEMANFKDKMKV